MSTSADTHGAHPEANRFDEAWREEHIAKMIERHGDTPASREMAERIRNGYVEDDGQFAMAPRPGAGGSTLRRWASSNSKSDSNSKSWNPFVPGFGPVIGKRPWYLAPHWHKGQMNVACAHWTARLVLIANLLALVAGFVVLKPPPGVASEGSAVMGLWFMAIMTFVLLRTKWVRNGALEFELKRLRKEPDQRWVTRVVIIAVAVASVMLVAGPIRDSIPQNAGQPVVGVDGGVSETAIAARP